MLLACLLVLSFMGRQFLIHSFIKHDNCLTRGDHLNHGDHLANCSSDPNLTPYSSYSRPYQLLWPPLHTPAANKWPYWGSTMLLKANKPVLFYTNVCGFLIFCQSGLSRHLWIASRTLYYQIAPSSSPMALQEHTPSRQCLIVRRWVPSQLFPVHCCGRSLTL